MKDIIKVLDHGFVKLRNIAGPTRRTFNPIDPAQPNNCGTERPFDADDTDVANAARLSFEGQDQDRTYDTEMKLNRYLLVNKHMTPFETIVVWLEMKLPIFVARQLVRQRTQTINEASARYIQLPAEWYIPELADVLIQSKDKKQGGKPIDLNDPVQVDAGERYRMRLQANCELSYRSYEQSIADGIAMEQARLELHVNHYTHWMTTMSLRNLFMSFLVLRDHSHAQIESQQYARATIQLLEPHLPGLMDLYKLVLKELQ